MMFYSLVNDSSYQKLDYVTIIGILETKDGGWFLKKKILYQRTIHIGFFNSLIKSNKITWRACDLFDI